MTKVNEIGTVATVTVINNKDTCVIYHDTTVVKFNDAQIVLESGGWRTATTKRRMNQASNVYGLGYQVYQKDKTWYVDYQGETLEFYDGMALIR